MKARYATTCGVCGQPVVPGDEIASLAGAHRQWAHEGCQPGLDLGLPAEADPGPPQGVEMTGQPTLASAAPGAAPGAAAPATDALEVWTDGACSGNPGPGGWAWATKDGRQGWGSDPATTNQRMEIHAALDACRRLPRPLVVVSDSTYVVNCFRDGWWRGWLARGWTTSAKKPVANQDLWKPLVEAVGAGGVTFRWVKGHSGDMMNDLVDGLAVRAGQQQSSA